MFVRCFLVEITPKHIQIGCYCMRTPKYVSEVFEYQYNNGNAGKIIQCTKSYVVFVLKKCKKISKSYSTLSIHRNTLTNCNPHLPTDPQVSVHASAHIKEIKAINDFDTVAAIFHFPSGTVGMVDLSRNSCYGYDQRVEVFGPRGCVDADNEQPLHCVTTQIGQQGQRRPPIWYSFASRFRNAYAKEMEHFLDVVLGKCQPAVHPKEILAVSKIASACEESARSGKTVDIKWADGELPPGSA